MSFIIILNKRCYWSFVRGNCHRGVSWTGVTNEAPVYSFLEAGHVYIYKFFTTIIIYDRTIIKQAARVTAIYFSITIFFQKVFNLLEKFVKSCRFIQIYFQPR